MKRVLKKLLGVICLFVSPIFAEPGAKPVHIGGFGDDSSVPEVKVVPQSSTVIKSKHLLAAESAFKEDSALVVDGFSGKLYFSGINDSQKNELKNISAGGLKGWKALPFVHGDDLLEAQKILGKKGAVQIFCNVCFSRVQKPLWNGNLHVMSSAIEGATADPVAAGLTSTVLAKVNLVISIWRCLDNSDIYLLLQGVEDSPVVLEPEGVEKLLNFMTNYPGFPRNVVHAAKIFSPEAIQDLVFLSNQDQVRRWHLRFWGTWCTSMTAVGLISATMSARRQRWRNGAVGAFSAGVLGWVPALVFAFNCDKTL